MFIVAYVAYEKLIFFQNLVYLKNKSFLLKIYCVIDVFYLSQCLCQECNYIIVFISIPTFCFASSTFWVWFFDLLY